MCGSGSGVGSASFWRLRIGIGIILADLDPDRHHFGGFGSGSASFWRIRIRIGIFLADSDPGRNPGPADPIFIQKVSIWGTVQNNKNFNTYENDEKDKCQFFYFLTCLKLGAGSGST
jgi:hypothetical protein